MIALLGLLFILWIVCILVGIFVKAVGWLLIIGLIGLVITALGAVARAIFGSSR
jgi:hypothetical protein